MNDSTIPTIFMANVFVLSVFERYTDPDRRLQRSLFRLEPKREEIGEYPFIITGSRPVKQIPRLNLLSPQLLSCRFEVVLLPAGTAILPR
jgi:hypothetical protein